MVDINYESLIPIENNNNEQTNNLDEKYKNITNVSQVKNEYIIQPEQNKFIINNSNNLYGAILAFCFFLIILVSMILTIIVYYSEEGSNSLKIFFFVFFGIILLLLLINIFFTPLKRIVTFEETSFKIDNIRIFSCFSKTIIYKYSEVRKFDIELKFNQKRIVYYDKNEEKKFLFSQVFNIEEAEYFIYCANKYLK